MTVSGQIAGRVGSNKDMMRKIVLVQMALPYRRTGCGWFSYLVVQFLMQHRRRP